jgi:[NiFe] hydrogenase diaphorase moiety small subunit
MKSSVTLLIDGEAVEASPGQTILEAAEAAGIYIPRLCAFPGVPPQGGCRVCSVRVNGRIQAACVQTVSDGAVVENETPELAELRRSIIDLLFIEGNHYCMFCEKSGHCELQALAYRFGIAAPRYTYLNPQRDMDLSHPDVYLDRNRCILCGRCVRVSQELDGKNVFQFVGRGIHKKLQVNGDSLGETDLQVTDQAVQACPVGALMKKRVGYAVPVGRRPYDAEPIGSAIEQEKGA